MSALGRLQCTQCRELGVNAELRNLAKLIMERMGTIVLIVQCVDYSTLYIDGHWVAVQCSRDHCRYII